MSRGIDAVQELDEAGAEQAVLGSRAGARRGSSFRLWIVLALGLGALFLAGYLPRQAQRERLLASAALGGPLELPRVMVVPPKQADHKRVLKLPATLEPSEHTAIYARASGYVRRWLVDLGDDVRAGQLLVEIETPELDRELQEARAELAQRAAGVRLAHASRQFAGETLKRYELLTARKLTSKQELDEYQAEARVSEAKLEVAEAERGAHAARVHRLEQLRAFAQVRAPFAGTITARHVERGALVAAGAGSPLFELATLDALRIDLHVPQPQIAGVRPGLAATLTVAELPGRRFQAVVAHTAGRLDAKSRTLHVELAISNQERALLPGMYASAELELESAVVPWIVPASALLSAKEGGSKLALVELTSATEGEVHFLPVEVARDLGAEVEIVSALSADARVIVSPAPGLSEGTRVRTDG